MKKRELELYIHIPFCAKRCDYCDFLSFVRPERVQEEYVKRLIEEIEQKSANFLEYDLTTIFIGGGTPSILKPELIREIMETVFSHFSSDGCTEVTIEANPGTLTEEKLRIYRKCGINRISLGLQSADDGELKKLGRIHTFDAFLKSYQRAREVGFSNINIDLMSAIPGQHMETWKSTLRKVSMLKPEHISAYSLMIEEGTPFGKLYGEEQKQGLDSAHLLPDEEEERAMYEFTKVCLQELGYERYEISNYAKPGFECRHNIGYWTGVEYLGVGLGASSYLCGARMRQTEDLEQYRKAFQLEEREELTLEARMEEFMFLGLRLMAGVSEYEFAARFGRSIWETYGTILSHLEQEGLLEILPPKICLTPRGIDVSNYVMSQFLFD